MAHLGQCLNLTTGGGTSVQWALSWFWKSNRVWAWGIGGGPWVL